MEDDPLLELVHFIHVNDRSYRSALALGRLHNQEALQIKR